MTDNERLQAIKARRAAITKGVWEWHEVMQNKEPVPEWYVGLFAMNLQVVTGIPIMLSDDKGYVSCSTFDAAFIENAPQDIDYLLSVIEQSNKANRLLADIKPLSPSIIRALDLLSRPGAYVDLNGYVCDNEARLGNIKPNTLNALVDRLFVVYRGSGTRKISKAGREALERSPMPIEPSQE